MSTRLLLAQGRSQQQATGNICGGNPVIIKPIHLGGDLISLNTNVQLSSPDLDPLISKELNLQEAVQQFKKQLIQRALTKNDGNWAATAKDFGMHRSNLHHLATRLGLREKSKNIIKNS
jgi:anaerobic nitric oxide reductase transcription regulator